MKTLFAALVGIAVLMPAASVSAEEGDGLREAAEAMKKAPNDQTALRKYMGAALRMVQGKARSDEKAALAILKTMETDLKAVKPTDAAAKRLLQGAIQFLPRMKASVERSRKQKELVGKKAFKLDAELWVNGSPLTDKDLEGKVVLLDFWAVWCGPCIRTFPHLREWQTKWGDKGLVIVGATKFYGYKSWDDEKKRGVRKRGVTSTPEEEKAVLVKFAEHHKLKHRFMVQPKNGKFADQYYASAIPLAVLIDQKGVIRLIKVGANPANAKAIEAMIEKLLDTKTTSTK